VHLLVCYLNKFVSFQVFILGVFQMIVVFCVFTLEYIWLFLSTDTTLVPELNATCSV